MSRKLIVKAAAAAVCCLNEWSKAHFWAVYALTFCCIRMKLSDGSLRQDWKVSVSTSLCMPVHIHFPENQGPASSGGQLIPVSDLLDPVCCGFRAGLGSLLKLLPDLEVKKCYLQLLVKLEFFKTIFMADTLFNYLTGVSLIIRVIPVLFIPFFYSLIAVGNHAVGNVPQLS